MPDRVVGGRELRVTARQRRDQAGENTLETGEAEGAKFVDGLLQGHGGGIAGLRRRPAQALLETMLAHPELRRAEPKDVVVDGYVLPEQPALVFQEGREAPIPLLAGNTSRDGDLPSMGVRGTPKARAAAADLARPLARTHKVAALDAEGATAVQDYYRLYPDLAAAAAGLYADARDIDPKDGDAIIAFDTDRFLRCGASLIAAWHTRLAPTWRFEFSHGYEPLGAVHIWDLMYLFGWLQPPADQPRDVRLSEQLQRYWVNFARTGDPNGAGLPWWPKSGDGGRYLDFASDGAVVEDGPRQAACDLFARKTERDLKALRATPKSH